MLSSIGSCLLRFAIGMLMELRSEHEHGNILCSPFITGTALSMVAFGAGGNTSKQLFSALHLARCSDGVDEHLSTQMGNLSEHSPKTSLLTANRLYIDARFQVLETYRLLVERLFETSVELVDFTYDAERARSEINSWISDQTESKVTHLLPKDSVDNSTRMVLINALYFKAFWERPFRLRKTRTFSMNPKREVDVVMMHMHGELNFAYDDQLLSVAIELPYKGGHCSLVIFLPYEVDGLRSVEERLSVDTLRLALSQLSPGRVALTMPKFKIAIKTDLEHTLKRLGVRDVFRPGVANLSGIVDSGDLWLSDIFHETYFRVEEDGTESAAGTVEVSGANASWPPRDPSDLTYIDVDHPFLFVVRDNVQDVILLMGSLIDLREGY
ncbi:iris-like [Rhipicephalus microplus]|uniref:iris-like n=1 Tax=Rhipicephalus microplus TaxID=6941 RepID=UPI003F6B733E